ncbi:ABC transporter [Thauera sp. 28]|uniref:hypothetical protein n=1 Tax=Thauera sp. 28 TaxID=303682 RepID=UPI0002CE256B|nr:hypothetical protein [Thauera sp. 28]ENO93949.1 ABC transporter [Thauera sp. 28]
MLEQLLLFAPGFVLGLFMSAVLAALGVILRLRDEALSAFSHAQVAVLGAMLAVIAGWPLLIGAWGLAMLVAVAGLWLIKPVAAVASSRHLLVLLLAWSACLLLADNHAQARLLSASAVEGQLLLVQWRDVVAHGVVGALGAAVLGGVSKALLAHQLLPWLPGAPGRAHALARELAVVAILATGALASGIFVTLALVLIPAWSVWASARGLRAAVLQAAILGASAHVLAFGLALVLDQVYPAVMIVVLALMAAAASLRRKALGR